MWFVSKKKYDEALKENARLRKELEHANTQIGALTTLWHEEIRDHEQFYKETIKQLQSC